MNVIETANLDSAMFICIFFSDEKFVNLKEKKFILHKLHNIFNKNIIIFC